MKAGRMSWRSKLRTLRTHRGSGSQNTPRLGIRVYDEVELMVEKSAEEQALESQSLNEHIYLITSLEFFTPYVSALE